MNIQNLNLDAAATVTTAIDTLGALQAEIANLTYRAERIKDSIKALGDGAYEGATFRATVSTSERETLDMKAVREKLSPQFIAAHTNVTTVVTLKMSSRKGV
jgi:hypothetical protein